MILVVGTARFAYTRMAGLPVTPETMPNSAPVGSPIRLSPENRAFRNPAVIFCVTTQEKWDT